MHVAKTRLLDMHGFGSNRATREFIKRIEDLNPDIIHLHNIHGYYVNVELLFDYLKGRINQLYGHYMIAGDSQGTVHILIMFLVIGGKKNALVVRKKRIPSKYI